MAVNPHMFRSHTFVHSIFALMLLVYVGIGLRIYSDYGIPLDEYSQIDIGRVNYERIFKGNQEIQTHFDRYYGPVFEVPLYMFSRNAVSRLGIDEMSGRHLGIFLFFSFSLIVFYSLLTNINGHPVYGLAGVFWLVVTPRFFAESFYNTKDMAFLSATIFVLYVGEVVQKKTWNTVLALAIATGFAIAVRAQGLLLLLVYSLQLFFEKKNVSKRLIVTASYIVSALLVAYIFSPIFWNDTVKNIAGFWLSSANPVGVVTKYLGATYVSPDRPWHYHIVWVGITSMLSVLLFSIVGLMWWTLRRDRGHASMFLIIALTFITSIFFHPRSYDGWRHMYYIYPCMIGFAVYGLRQIAARVALPGYRWLLVGALTLISIDSALSLRFIVRNHPNQYVYFNALAGGYANAKKNFDFDYWGVSYQQIFRYVSSQPAPQSVYIDFRKPSPFIETIMIPELRKRGMSITNSANSSDLYILVNRDNTEPPEGFIKVYSVRVEGADLSAVYERL